MTLFAVTVTLTAQATGRLGKTVSCDVDPDFLKDVAVRGAGHTINAAEWDAATKK